MPEPTTLQCALSTAHSYSVSKNWATSIVWSRMDGFGVILVEGATLVWNIGRCPVELIAKVVFVVLDNGLGKSLFGQVEVETKPNEKKTINKISKWNNETHPTEPFIAVGKLLAGLGASILFAWSMPTWNKSIHENLGLYEDLIDKELKAKQALEGSLKAKGDQIAQLQADNKRLREELAASQRVVQAQKEKMEKLTQELRTTLAVDFFPQDMKDITLDLLLARATQLLSLVRTVLGIVLVLFNKGKPTPARTRHHSVLGASPAPVEKVKTEWSLFEIITNVSDTMQLLAKEKEQKSAAAAGSPAKPEKEGPKAAASAANGHPSPAKPAPEQQPLPNAEELVALRAENERLLKDNAQLKEEATKPKTLPFDVQERLQSFTRIHAVLVQELKNKGIPVPLIARMDEGDLKVLAAEIPATPAKPSGSSNGPSAETPASPEPVKPAVPAVVETPVGSPAAAPAAQNGGS